jgi:adenosylmethionine-8-amino-7-oxononanoate aminotransferase
LGISEDRGYSGASNVRDKQTKEAFSRLGAAVSVTNAAFARGVQVYTCEGIADGTIGDGIILAPAYNCSDDEIAMIVDVLAAAIKELHAF